MRGRRSTRGIRLVLAGALAVGATIGPSPPASAACHAFTVTVEPATVDEGADVTVTVSRDAGVAPSQVDVETVDGTAAGGSDYEAVARRTIEFASETDQTFSIPTIDDGEAESAETFALHLSNPSGCAVNPNFVVGPDAQVTVTDNDEAATAEPTTSAPPRPSTTVARASTTSTTDEPATTSSTAAGSTTASTSTTRSSSTTTEMGELAADVGGADDADDDDGTESSGVVVALAALVAVAVAGGALWAWRRRTGTGTG